jgi:hypothetical protein
MIELSGWGCHGGCIERGGGEEGEVQGDNPGNKVRLSASATPLFYWDNEKSQTPYIDSGVFFKLISYTKYSRTDYQE